MYNNPTTAQNKRKLIYMVHPLLRLLQFPAPTTKKVSSDWGEVSFLIHGNYYYLVICLGGKNRKENKPIVPCLRSQVVSKSIMLVNNVFVIIPCLSTNLFVV